MGRKRLFRKTEFGVANKAYYATFRLRDLLALENSPIVFETFKKQLYQIAQKHLDVKDVPRNQGEKWTWIEAELRSTFPDIFGCENLKPPSCDSRLELAMQMITSYHYSRRQSASRAQLKRAPLAEYTLPNEGKRVVNESAMLTRAMEKKRQAKKDIIDLTADDDDDDKHDDHDQKAEFVEPKLAQTMDIFKLQPVPATIETALPLEPIPSASYAESSSQARNASFNKGKQRAAFQSTDVDLVARFLNACLPSMAHLLEHFVGFGCKSEEYLVAVSTWPADKILFFLSQVSERAGDGRRITEMDKLVLQNHFLSYFNKT